MRAIVNIDVPELAPAGEFYSKALGLVLSRVIDDDVAELIGAEVPICFLVSKSGSAPGKSIAETRRYTRHWTPVHVDFVVDDLVRSVERALQAGARQESECVEWRGSRCVTFSDPFGHGFCLIEFDGDGYS